MPGPSISSTFTAPDCAARRELGGRPRCSKLRKTQPVSFTQPAPISMSGATLPGAGTKVRSRTPRRTRPRTRAIGWPWKIQPPMPRVMPSLTAAKAVSRSTIFLETVMTDSILQKTRCHPEGAARGTFEAAGEVPRCARDDTECNSTGCSTPSKPPSAPQHVSGDDQALDLVGALEDLGDLGVAHEAIDREVAHVAGAAEDLHRVGRDLHRRVAGEALEHRCPV